MSEKREHKIVVRNGKNVTINERDYRAFLAFTLSIGLIALLWNGNYEGASVIAPLAGSSIAWYFSKKEGKAD